MTPSSCRSQVRSTISATPIATEPSIAAASCGGRCLNKPKASTPPPTSSAGSASCSMKIATPSARKITIASPSISRPMTYGIGPFSSRSPNSMPIAISNGIVASHAPSPINSTTGHGRGSRAGMPASAESTPSAVAASTTRSNAVALMRHLARRPARATRAGLR
jgi:hypothetical protein